MATPKTIKIDETEYVRADSVSTPDYDGDIKIVILQRGWIVVGRLERDGNQCKLHSGSVIRSWGTTKGLGEIAENGPLANTKLDKCYGVIEFDYLTVVATIGVNEAKWTSSL